MGVKIIALNERNEPYNLNHANINEEIFFFWEPDPISSSVNLTGEERWVWNFDSSNTSGLAADTITQEIIDFSEPISVLFKRSGDREVNLKIWDDFSTSGTSFLLYEDTVNFDLFEFPTSIDGPEFISSGGIANYSVDSTGAEKYQWFLNGDAIGTNSPNLSISFNNIVRANIKLIITNGTISREYDYLTLLNFNNSVFGERYEGNIKDNLLFFNKEGDNLNFEYVEDETGQKYWDGEMIFHENSNDTFKTIGLYTLEKVDPISFKSQNLNLRKLQLFNEFGVDFQPSYSEEISIDSVEVSNNQSNFYTKWLNSPNIHLSIPVGSEIILKDFYHINVDDSIPENPILTNFEIIEDLNSESTSGGYNTFTVVDSRKDSIMIITKTENPNWNINYGFGEFRLQNNSIQNIPQGKILSLNTIKIIDSEKLNSEWNEPKFKSQLYDRKKLTVVNSQKNDGVYTVDFINDDESNELNDKLFKIECININELIPNTKFGFRIKLDFRTNKIFLSSSAVDFLPESTNSFLNDKNVLVWESTLNKDFTPGLIKKGRTFFFEQLTPNEPNLDNIFETISVNEAGEILEPQTTDLDGWKIELKDFDKISNLKLEFLVNETTEYEVVEGTNWNKGIALEDSALALSDYLNSNIFGIKTINIDNEIWIWEVDSNNIKLVNESDLDDSVISWSSGILRENNPVWGIVGDSWVKLNNSSYSGYIHHRVDQNNYHILYFKGSFPNETPVWYTLPLNKKVVQVEQTNTLEFKENLIADAYLEDTTLFFKEEGNNKSVEVLPEELIQRFIEKNKTSFSNNGLDMYVDGTNFCISRLYPVNSLNNEDDYLIVDFQQPRELIYGTNFTSGTPEWIDISSDLDFKTIKMFNVLEDLNEEFNRNFGIKERKNTISELWERKIIIKDIDAVNGFNLNINGIDYSVNFDNISVSGTTSKEDKFLDIEETLLDWGNQKFKQNNDIEEPGFDSDIGKKYHVVLEEQGILTWLEKSGEAIVSGNKKWDTIVLQSKYPNININYDVSGTLNNHKIKHTDVEFFEINDRLTITINDIDYTTPFTNTIDNTLLEWKETYSESLLLQDIIVDFDEGKEGTSGTSFEVKESGILKFSTLDERTQFNIRVWVGKNPIPGRNLYNIINHRKGREGIILSGNEIITTGVDLQTLGFSTGMITALKNSKFALNNQEYNLLFVDPGILGLSYQGPFWNNSDSLGYNFLRSGFSFDFHDDTGTPPRIKFKTNNVNLSHNIIDITHNIDGNQIVIGDGFLSVIEYPSETVIHQTSGFSNSSDIRWYDYATTSGSSGLVNLDLVDSKVYTFNSYNYSLDKSYDLKSIVSSSAQLTDIEILKSLSYLFLDETNNRIYFYDNKTDILKVNFDMGSTFDPVSILLANVYNGVKNSVAVLCELTSEVRFYDVEDGINSTSGNYNISFDTSVSIPFTPRKMIGANYYVWSDINAINDKHLIVIGDEDIAFVNRVTKTLVNTISFPSLIVDSEIGFKGDLDYLWILTTNTTYEIDIRTQLIKNNYSDNTTYSSVIYNSNFDVLFLSDTLNDRVLSVDASNYKKLNFYNTGVSPSQLINNAYDEGKIGGSNDKVYVRNANKTITIIKEDETFVSGSTSGFASTSSTSGNILENLEIKTRQYLRYPRERLDNSDPIVFKFSWEDNNDSSMFYYDFSGDQLDKKFRDEGVFQYKGPKPLINEDDVAYLNKKPNRIKEEVENPKVQQTVFDELYYNLLLIDSEEEIDPTPFPLQTFIGYKSKDEGVNERTAIIERLENIKITLRTKKKDENDSNSNWVNILNFDSSNNSVVLKNSDINFIEEGFKAGQRVNFKGRDVLNENNSATFKNSGFRGEIEKVTVNKLVLKPLNKKMKTESSLTSTRNLIPPFNKRDAAFEITIEVEPGLVAKINIKGQTEIEDERYKVILDNFGKNINHDEVFLFKGYDIKESGIDWQFLNEKRKEMLILYPEIYNFLGSYKAVVNAINYFGHNDLEFYEYYLNIDKDSRHFNKLHKIEIPDLFNNRIDGYTPNDFILRSLPNKRYQKTNLFNLTYRITDKRGNIILAYSLEEVIIKLLGLKKWLQENVIPIGKRILDLTGRGDSVSTTRIWHDVKQVRKLEFKEDLTPIDFSVEAYLQPVENNSKTYNMHLEFLTNSYENVPDYFHLKITTFSAKPDFKSPDFKLRSVQNINIYKTDFKSYNFTADKTTDPFILIEVISDNGYGATFTKKRTFSLETLAFI